MLLMLVPGALGKSVGQRRILVGGSLADRLLLSLAAVCLKLLCPSVILQAREYRYEVIFQEPDTPWKFNVRELTRYLSGVADSFSFYCYALGKVSILSIHVL